MKTADIGHGRGWLATAAAASLRRVDAALGRPLQTTWAGRTRDQQQRLWEKYGPPRAARPGTSPHEAGRSIDTDERPLALLAEHGWIQHPDEDWHFNYVASRDQHRNTPTGSAELPDQEEEMPFIAVCKGDWYLVIGKQAHLLGAASGAADSGIPIIRYVDDWAVKQLKTVVSGIK